MIVKIIQECRRDREVTGERPVLPLMSRFRKASRGPKTTSQANYPNAPWPLFPVTNSLPEGGWSAAGDNSKKRAQVTGHTLWVAPYEQEERWPCGDFPVQSVTDTGLPAWTCANRSIEDTDVVLWYVFGIHHIPRPEDWPVMPSDAVSFWLKPFGFFDRNPALDVPPGHHC
ncbi:MAG TPA: hypothetical protein VGG75_08870 [Trebonia sp.]|jgi:Cu2+-containing amine oxidase